MFPFRLLSCDALCNIVGPCHVFLESFHCFAEALSDCCTCLLFWLFAWLCVFSDRVPSRKHVSRNPGLLLLLVVSSSSGRPSFDHVLKIFVWDWPSVRRSGTKVCRPPIAVVSAPDCLQVWGLEIRLSAIVCYSVLAFFRCCRLWPVRFN